MSIELLTLYHSWQREEDERTLTHLYSAIDSLKIDLGVSQRENAQLKAQVKACGDLADDAIKTALGLKEQLTTIQAAATKVVNNYFYWSGIYEPDITCFHDVKLQKIMTELNNLLRDAKVGE